MDLLFKIEPFETFKKVSGEVIKTLHKSEQTTFEGLQSNLINSIKDEIIKLVSTYNFDINLVVEKIKKSVWDIEKVNFFISLLEENRTNLFYSILLNHNSMHGDSVTDYNWLLKLVLGTSDSKVLRYPLLQLDLSTVYSSSEQKQRLYDFNKESLSRLIMVLESCLEIN